MLISRVAGDGGDAGGLVVGGGGREGGKQSRLIASDWGKCHKKKQSDHAGNWFTLAARGAHADAVLHAAAGSVSAIC